MLTLQGTTAAIDGQTIIVGAYKDGGQIRWHCQGGTLEPKYRPVRCRP